MYLFWKKCRWLLNQWVAKPYTVSDNMFVEKYYEEQMCFSNVFLASYYIFNRNLLNMKLSMLGTCNTFLKFATDSIKILQ